MRTRGSPSSHTPTHIVCMFECVAQSSVTKFPQDLMEQGEMGRDRHYLSPLQYSSFPSDTSPRKSCPVPSTASSRELQGLSCCFLRQLSTVASIPVWEPGHLDLSPSTVTELPSYFVRLAIWPLHLHSLSLLSLPASLAAKLLSLVS